MKYLVTDWLINLLIGWLIDWLNDQLLDVTYVIDPLIYWIPWQLFDMMCQCDWLIDLLIDWLYADWLTGCYVAVCPPEGVAVPRRFRSLFQHQVLHRLHRRHMYPYCIFIQNINTKHSYITFIQNIHTKHS